MMKSRLSSIHSLVNRGANAIVSGSVVRVIGTYPYRKVYINVIDKYEITNIPLVTAG